MGSAACPDHAVRTRRQARTPALCRGDDAALPGETTILRFRRLLEEHKLAPQILALVNALLSAKGLMLRAGTAVGAALIAAPSWTKNASGERDPQMKQSKKGKKSKQWYFGMKAHIGVDADSGLVLKADDADLP